jgi:hypothetical protein
MGARLPTAGEFNKLIACFDFELKRNRNFLTEKGKQEMQAVFSDMKFGVAENFWTSTTPCQSENELNNTDCSAFAMHFRTDLGAINFPTLHRFSSEKVRCVRPIMTSAVH